MQRAEELTLDMRAMAGAAWPREGERQNWDERSQSWGAPYPDNLTGIHPTEFKVLIAPKPVEEKKGSIFIPDATKESEKFAQTEGRILAVSHLAFTYAKDEEWGEHRPKPGDMVLYAKYAGLWVKGKDGKEYILANDKDICAIIEE